MKSCPIPSDVVYYVFHKHTHLFHRIISLHKQCKLLPSPAVCVYVSHVYVTFCNLHYSINCGHMNLIFWNCIPSLDSLRVNRPKLFNLSSNEKKAHNSIEIRSIFSATLKRMMKCFQANRYSHPTVFLKTWRVIFDFGNQNTLRAFIKMNVMTRSY